MPKLLVSRREITKTFAYVERTAENHALYLELSGVEARADISAEVRHSIPPGYHLVRVDGRVGSEAGKCFEIALLNDLTQAVVYYNKVIITELVDQNCRPATQMLVWRSTDAQHGPVLRDLPSNVFFNYILERYDVILSDQNQTREGHTFWQRHMSLALARNLHVYYYRMLSASLQPIANQQELDDLTDVIWGEADGQEDHLALISRVQLPLQLTVQFDE